MRSRTTLAVLFLVAALTTGGIVRAQAPEVDVVSSSGTTFDHATVVDPFRLIGEPGLAIDSRGHLYAHGPGSSPTQHSFFWKSEDGGSQWHVVGVVPEYKSNGQNGGGDTEITIDKNDVVYGSDLQTLICNSAFRSTDRGKTFTTGEACLPGTDRQWMDTYTDASGNTRVYLISNQTLLVTGLGCYILVSEHSPVPQNEAASRTGLAYHPPVGGTGLVGGSCIGHLAVDDRNGHIYVPTTAGVRRSTNGGVSWTTIPGSPITSGTLFSSLALDSEGNLYQASANGSTVRFAAWRPSTGTWTSSTIPMPGLRRALFAWPVAGDAGRVAVAFYGTDDAGSTGGYPGGPNAKWHTYLAYSLDALSASPSFDLVRVSEHPMHRGAICTGGFPGCLTGNADRSLADFFMVEKDPRDGRVYVVYNDGGDVGPVSRIGRAYVVVSRQRTGPSLFEDVGEVSPPTTANVAIASARIDEQGRVAITGTHGLPGGNWTSDSADDANEPWAPVTGPSIPALDIREASAGDDGTNLVFKMRLADLSPAALAGAAQAAGEPTWTVTWWHEDRTATDPTGRAGKQAHYFVKWLGGTQFVYGETVSADFPQLGAPAPKFVAYPPTGVATGTVTGNEITVSVPAAAVGNVRPGDKIDNVTAWTWSERAQIPTVVDQAKSFSYRFGTPASEQHAADGFVEVSLDDPSFSSPVAASLSKTDNTWSVELPDPGAGRHTVYARQVLSSSLYTPEWSDIVAGPTAQATVAARIPSLSIGDAAVLEGNEGATAVRVALTLSEPTTDTVSLDVAAADGTAVSPDDFSLAPLTVTFAPGDVHREVEVQVHGDLEPEPDETFTVEASNVTDANVADGTGLVTIANDDAGPACTVLGTGGDDVLVGTAEDDVVCGLGGNDTLQGLNGNDVLIGGAGEDRLLGDNGDDLLRGQEGGDILTGGRGNDVIVGFTGGDTLLGDAGDDALQGVDGVDGNDRLDGGLGADMCTGDPGDVVAGCP